MSIDKSDGKRPSRRSDCEELIYTLFSLIQSKLPLEYLRGKNHIKNCTKMCELKKKILSNILLQDIPKEFLFVYKNIRALKYEEEPDYNAYNIILKSLIINKIII